MRYDLQLSLPGLLNSFCFTLVDKQKFTWGINDYCYYMCFVGSHGHRNLALHCCMSGIDLFSSKFPYTIRFTSKEKIYLLPGRLILNTWDILPYIIEALLEKFKCLMGEID